jgi:endoglucanase
VDPVKAQRGKAQVIVLAIAVVATAVALAVVAIPRGGASLPAALVPKSSPPPTSVPVTAPPPSALHVQGTNIMNAAGRVVTLRGVSRPSLEYACAGDGHFTQNDFQAMRAWGANVVRITLSSEFWANAGNDCPNYHSTVAQAVANAEAVGLYVIVDLQWNAPLDTPQDRATGGAQCPMPDADHDVAFWHDLATIYASDPRVLFDLFGEPHDVSWSVWLHGGTISNALCFLISRTGGVETGSYRAEGMATLVRSVRAIAPATVLIVSGIDWGYQLDRLPHYLIHTTNLLYGTHPFNYVGKQPTNWPHDFGTMTARYPIIATEFGSYDCNTAYSQAAIAYFTAHHMSWLAWAWNTAGCSGPGLLADWSGTPSQPYGAYIQHQMQAAKAGV